jgi:hypothetical protein
LCHSLQYNSLLHPPQPQHPPQQHPLEQECSTSSTSQQSWQKPQRFKQHVPPPSWQQVPQPSPQPHAGSPQPPQPQAGSQHSPQPHAGSPQPPQPPRSWQQFPRHRPSGSMHRQFGGPLHLPQPCHR